MANINLNQFAPSRLQGEVDENQPFSGRVEPGVVSANQATALTPGMAVKLDTSAQPASKSFVAAAAGDTADGIIVFSKRKASFSAGDAIDVAYDEVVIWLTATGSIAAGASVEDSATSGVVQTKAANAMRGIAQDPATTGQLLRVLKKRS